MASSGNQVSGGCQCGAVRYRATPQPETSHICHCRMCQKAAGNVFAALVGVARDAIIWTRGAPTEFASSADVTRGFCRDCGTPLTYSYRTSKHLCVTTGSLDNPAAFPPQKQFGIEARLDCIAGLPALPDEGTTEATMAAQVGSIKASNRQHPDHDTDNWPA
jgi:hypothetical protein